MVSVISLAIIWLQRLDPQCPSSDSKVGILASRKHKYLDECNIFGSMA